MTALPDPDYQPQFYRAVASKRLLAWLIDSVIIAGLCFAVSVMTVFIGFFFWPVLFLVLGFAYRVVTIANGSATWGMRFAGIELRSLAGQTFDLRLAVLHTAGYSISLMLPLLQVISVIMMLTSSRGQGLTDACLGTAALNRRV
ncbi:RDD family protein [Parasedimentitalea psychrophila]|uniref:RDD family protein n=1 Tax=Parasedimentitalea psychrophila TaxID=2997337 RepID=A0A9Y2KZ21_9RHOB|nr:RDD family protein [Parasedimentitalea psychrophila]WIY25074.1 RDD family protein [Parasedimentitalea psychrophila]